MAWPGSKMNGMSGGLELFGVLQHAFAAVRGDDTNRYTVIRRHLDAVRMVHRARMERGDLVGIEVRGDERLRAMLFRNRHEVLLGHALASSSTREYGWKSMPMPPIG